MINITEDKTVIAYTVRVRRAGKGQYDSIYVFGNSPEEFVQNLKDQLKERGYGELGKESAVKIKRNLEKQLQQFQNLDLANESKRLKLKDMLIEAVSFPEAEELIALYKKSASKDPSLKSMYLKDIRDFQSILTALKNSNFKSLRHKIQKLDTSPREDLLMALRDDIGREKVELLFNIEFRK